MEYDVYCAICGVAFCGFEIGPWSPAALEQRDRYVDGEMSEKEAEENAPVGYDPRVVDPDDCDWLLDVYCLGYSKMQLSSLAIVSKVVDLGECMRVEERRRLERRWWIESATVRLNRSPCFWTTGYWYKSHLLDMYMAVYI
jgi:hypothetical protein